MIEIIGRTNLLPLYEQSLYDRIVDLVSNLIFGVDMNDHIHTYNMYVYIYLGNYFHELQTCVVL